MAAVPAKDIDEEEATLEGIRKRSAINKSAINKVPSVKIGKWNQAGDKKHKFILQLPEDVEIVEHYVYSFNRFVSPGENIYFRLNMFFDIERTSVAEIESIIAGLKNLGCSS